MSGLVHRRLALVILFSILSCSLLWLASAQLSTLYDPILGDIYPNLRTQGKQGVATLSLPTPNLVIASQKADNLTWLDHLTEWQKIAYVVDDTHAQYTVLVPKGKESMVYLTYIIDHYHVLPEINIFLHAERYQWHNDDPDYDGLRVLSRLRLDAVRAQGYVNLRCSWVLGCPVQIRPMLDENVTDERTTHHAYKRFFHELFPDREIPAVVAQTCCAQFAVTADVIRQHSRQYYIDLRSWLIAVDSDDSVTGRIFEFSWHMIFGQKPILCPTEQACYCRVYGLCDLVCTADGQCPGRYRLTPYSVMPQGWPSKGWNGQDRGLEEDTGMPA